MTADDHPTPSGGRIKLLEVVEDIDPD